MVQRLAGILCTHEEILECVPWGLPDGQVIDMKTLAKHFRSELGRGKALSKMKVKKRLADLIEQGVPSAVFFYLKTQCGWSETVKTEVTGAGGAALPAATFAALLCLPQKSEVPALVRTPIEAPGGRPHPARQPDRSEPRQEPPRSSREPLPAWHEPSEPSEPARRVAGAVRAYTYPDPRF